MVIELESGFKFTIPCQVGQHMVTCLNAKEGGVFWLLFSMCGWVECFDRCITCLCGQIADRYICRFLIA